MGTQIHFVHNPFVHAQKVHDEHKISQLLLRILNKLSTGSLTYSIPALNCVVMENPGEKSEKILASYNKQPKDQISDLKL